MQRVLDFFMGCFAGCWILVAGLIIAGIVKGLLFLAGAVLADQTALAALAFVVSCGLFSVYVFRNSGRETPACCGNKEKDDAVENS